jgi:transposase
MAGVMIGVDPHKASPTAVAISGAQEPLGGLRVRACAVQAQRLLAWAAAWPERTWAVEGAGALGHLLDRQLLPAGERVLDVQPKPGARVRLPATGNVNKNDPGDARPAAAAAVRSPGVRQARPDDHAAVLKAWPKRRRDLAGSRTQVVCRLHAVLCELVPGGVPEKIIAAHAARLPGSITPPMRRRPPAGSPPRP